MNLKSFNHEYFVTLKNNMNYALDKTITKQLQLQNN